MKEFDIYTTPWYIDVSKMTVEEKKEVGRYICGIYNYPAPPGYLFNTNVYYWTNSNAGDEGLLITPEILWGGYHFEICGREEIKFEFITVIDKVIYPKVKSEEQKKIEELEQIIKNAQAELNKMLHL